MSDETMITLAERIEQDGITMLTYPIGYTHRHAVPQNDEIMCVLRRPVPNEPVVDARDLGPMAFPDLDEEENGHLFGVVMTARFGGPDRSAQMVRDMITRDGGDPNEPWQPPLDEVLSALISNALQVEEAGGDFIEWIDSGMTSVGQQQDRYGPAPTPTEVAKELRAARTMFMRMTVDAADLKEFLGEKYHAYLHETDSNV